MTLYSIAAAFFFFAMLAGLIRFLYGRWYWQSSAISSFDVAAMGVPWWNHNKPYYPEEILITSAVNFGWWGKYTIENRCQRLKRLGFFELVILEAFNPKMRFCYKLTPKGEAFLDNRRHGASQEMTHAARS